MPCHLQRQLIALSYMVSSRGRLAIAFALLVGGWCPKRNGNCFWLHRRAGASLDTKMFSCAPVVLRSHEAKEVTRGYIRTPAALKRLHTKGKYVTRKGEKHTPLSEKTGLALVRGMGSGARLLHGGTILHESSHFFTVGLWNPEKQIQIPSSTQTPGDFFLM